MKTRIKELETILEEKNINNLKNENRELLEKINQLEELPSKNKIKEFNEKLNQQSLKISELYENIKEKNKLIKEYELKMPNIPFEISSGEKIISIVFISFDENIVFPFLCKNTDIFSFVENKFYEKYSNYKNLDNYFILNGKRINENISLDENKIKNNDIITIYNKNK